MALIQGLFSTGDVVTDGRPKDWADYVAYTQANGDGVLVGLFHAKTGVKRGQPARYLMRREVAKDPEFNWWDQDILGNEHTAINNGAGYTAGNTDMVVDDYTIFRANDLVLVPRTLEIMRVTATPSTTTVVFARSWGDVAAAALVDDDPLVCIGNVNEEGAALPALLSQNPTKRTNYTQIFRTPYGITGTQKETRVRYAPNELLKKRHDASIIHAARMERAFLFGDNIEDTSGSEPKRSTAGLTNQITTNISSLTSGILTPPLWSDLMRDAFAYGSRQKIALVGNTALGVIDQMCRNEGDMNMKPKSTSWGFQVMEMTSPFGTLMLKQHPLFTYNSTHAKYLIVVDMDDLKYRYINNRDTKVLTNRQARGDDSIKEEWFTECGLQVENEKHHYWEKNIASFQTA